MGTINLPAGSAFANRLTYRHWYYRLLNIAYSIFEWEGLPDSIDTRFLEKTLIDRGQAAFFYSKDFDDWICTGFAWNSGPNIYYNPYEIQTITPTGYAVNVMAKDCALIWNNFTRTPDLADIEMYTERLCNISRTTDVNVNTMKMPFIIDMDDKTKLSSTNQFNKVLQNEVAISQRKSQGGGFSESIRVLNTGAQFHGNELDMHMQFILSDFLNFFGIDSFFSTKKERNISGELSANTTSTGFQGLGRLKMRQKAAKRMSELYNNEITVHYSAEVIEQAKQFVNLEKGADISEDNSNA